MKSKSIYFYGFIFALCIASAATALQFVKGVEPCPLCIVQRFTFLILAVLCLIGMLIWRSRLTSAFISLLCVVFSGGGLVASGRQIWLQHFPNLDTQECAASLSYLLKVLPPLQALQKILQGSAECSEKGYTIFYLSLAEWSFICFAIFFGFAANLFLKTVWVSGSRGNRV